MKRDYEERAAALRRGLNFMGLRSDYVGDPECLEGMMMACIALGIDTRDGIVRTVPKYVGHSYPHVASILDQHTGSDPEVHYWWIGEDRIYRLHPILSCPPRRRPSKKAVSAVDHDIEDVVF